MEISAYAGQAPSLPVEKGAQVQPCRDPFKIAGLAEGLSHGVLFSCLVGKSLFLPYTHNNISSALILVPLTRLKALDSVSLGRQDIGSSVHWQQGEYP